METRILNEYNEVITRCLSISLGWIQAQEIARSEGYARLIGEGIDVRMEPMEA